MNVRIFFPLNGSIIEASINAHSAVYGVATRDAQGRFDLIGPGFQKINSAARALIYASRKVAAKGGSLIPWTEIHTLDLQGAAISETSLDEPDLATVNA